MNISAAKRRRKWANGSIWQRWTATVTVAAALILAQAAQAAAAASSPARGRMHSSEVPLPRPRPAEAPQAAPDKTKAASREKSAEPAAHKPPEPSACRKALTEDIAIAPSIPDIHGPGGCGGEDLVKLEAIVLADKHRVAVTPPATLRCRMASEIADWVRTEIVNLTAPLGSEPVVLENYDSYECRGFNGVPGAHLSEHGHANALDVHAIKLADGQSIELTDRSVPRELREHVLHSVCARFMTVLGPGSDWYHEDHIHLDLMERHNNYKICQWNVWDPLPKIAPMMPVARPDDAPPRAVAGKAEPDKGEADEPQAGEETKPASATGSTKTSATKKRR